MTATTAPLRAVRVDSVDLPCVRSWLLVNRDGELLLVRWHAGPRPRRCVHPAVCRLAGRCNLPGTAGVDRRAELLGPP